MTKPDTLTPEARSYLEDCKALRRSAARHKRLGWMDSHRSLIRQAKSRLGLAKMWRVK